MRTCREAHEWTRAALSENPYVADRLDGKSSPSSTVLRLGDPPPIGQLIRKENAYLKGKSLPVITSKLTSKAQTTIPQAVRAALRVTSGDELAYTIEGNRVILTKAPQQHLADNPFATFGEWASDNDRRAYGDL